MTFPNAHLYLTAHWITAGVTGETGQFGLRFDSTAPATQTLVDACKGAVQTMWTASTSAIYPDYQLQFLRLASIGTNGNYVPGTIAYDGIYTSPPVGGGVTTITRFPIQVAHVATLLTAMPRGQASHGRVYLPYLDDTIQSNWQWQLATTNSRMNTFSAMLTALNAVMPGPLTIFSKGTKAAPTVGAKNVVTQVQAGTRPDVQRRRAKGQVEVRGIKYNV